MKISILGLHDKMSTLTFMLDIFMKEIKGIVVEDMVVEEEVEEKEADEKKEEAAMEEEEEKEEEKEEEEKEKEEVVTLVKQASSPPTVEATPMTTSPAKPKASKKRKTWSRK